MGACVSPWSRPSCIVYASVRPCVVIMELCLVWWRFFNMLMYVLFILMQVSALLRPCQPTESYAFFMSCRIIQASLFVEDFASSHNCVKVVMGPCVDVPFSTEQLLPFKTLCVRQIFSILLVMTLVKIFLAVSISVMGRVMSTFLFQFFSLGIKMMLAFFQADGISSSSRTRLKISSSVMCTLVSAFRQHSYVNFDGPAALLLGVSARTVIS